MLNSSLYNHVEAVIADIDKFIELINVGDNINVNLLQIYLDFQSVDLLPLKNLLDNMANPRFSKIFTSNYPYISKENKLALMQCFSTFSVLKLHPNELTPYTIKMAEIIHDKIKPQNNLFSFLNEIFQYVTEQSTKFIEKETQTELDDNRKKDMSDRLSSIFLDASSPFVTTISDLRYPKHFELVEPLNLNVKEKLTSFQKTIKNRKIGVEKNIDWIVCLHDIASTLDKLELEPSLKNMIMRLFNMILVLNKDLSFVKKEGLNTGNTEIIDTDNKNWLYALWYRRRKFKLLPQIHAIYNEKQDKAVQVKVSSFGIRTLIEASNQKVVSDAQIKIAFAADKERGILFNDKRLLRTPEKIEDYYHYSEEIRNFVLAQILQTPKEISNSIFSLIQERLQEYVSFQGRVLMIYDEPTETKKVGNATGEYTKARIIKALAVKNIKLNGVADDAPNAENLLKLNDDDDEYSCIFVTVVDVNNDGSIDNAKVYFKFHRDLPVIIKNELFTRMMSEETNAPVKAVDSANLIQQADAVNSSSISTSSSSSSFSSSSSSSFSPSSSSSSSSGSRFSSKFNFSSDQNNSESGDLQNNAFFSRQRARLTSLSDDERLTYSK